MYTEEELISEASNNLEYLRPMIDFSESSIKISKIIGIDFGIEDLKELMFFNSLITICKLDLAISAKNLKSVNNKWEEIYFIKNSYLIINETIETYEEYNLFLKNVVCKYDNYSDFFNELNLKLKKFKRDYKVESEIKYLRNKTAAHIDKNFKLYYDTLSKLDKRKTLKMVDEFILINIDYLELCSDLFNEEN